MPNSKVKKLLLILVSIFAGFIANGCMERIMDSFARHGYISWADIIYPSKIVLIGSSYLSYRYLKNCLNATEGNFYRELFKKNVTFFILLAIATALVFSQHSIFQIFVHPIKTLLFRW